MSSSKVGKILTILAIAVVFGGLFGWWLSRQGGTIPSDVTLTKSGDGRIVTSASTSDTNDAIALLNSTNIPTNMIAVVPEGQEEKTNTGPAWDEKLDAIILGPEDGNAKVDKIIALMKIAPPEVQLEYSQHLINFATDDNYSGVAGILTNATTPDGVATVLMNDLLNRNNTLKLPMLLAIARTDDHSKKGDAKEMLELFIQEDHGSNWDDWSTAIDKWLKENQQ